ncbi:HlyD family type I secretion periplasmic adaptor subunit [Pseudomonas abieticivorans]|uniref:HlyD family type I secretion periplasmic adaptor subunit n=1 Tax=Pseudomonas abieticivorans TaxID=2931382 RepID=UPI0020BEB1DF|nr:HlyD family type I secretion periplasmic adaptor subunit [Pseudomonas sp. PIA16]
MSGIALHVDERRYARCGWALVLVGFLGFLAWAALAPLAQGVAVPGTVVVTGQRKVVQHAAGGIIERIHVHNGQAVEAGQVLLSLKQVPVQSQVHSLHAQWLSALADESRLEAELARQAQIAFAAALHSAGAQAEPGMALQRQLFSHRAQALRLEQQGLDQNISGTRSQLQGVLRALASNQQQRRVSGEQLLNLRRLASEGYITRGRLLDNERSQAQLVALINEQEGRVGQLHGQIESLRLQRRQLTEDFYKEVGRQLAQVRVNRADLENRLVAAQFELANASIRAPVAGVVSGLQVVTEGGVIQAGHTLLDIVPQGVQLQVEARLPVALVDKVQVGAPVELLFVAFNQSTTPRVAGRVSLLSADRQQDAAGGEPYYSVQIDVSEAGAAQLVGLTLRPGMPVQAFVRTGERTLLSYLTKPLRDRAHVALAEE